MTAHPLKQLEEELQEWGDHGLSEASHKTREILQDTIDSGYKHWILAFSGGKDSSLVATLVTEMLGRGSISGVEIDVVYSDTLMELPPFGDNALNLLSHIDKLGEEKQLPIRTHIAVAPIEQRYWFLIIGKGYPPPHNHFRWCTDRLKILPSRRVMKNVISDASVVLTGVRLGESDNRDSRLKAAMCSKEDSECGQRVWIDGDSEMGIPGLAPVAHWRTCQVWDLLMFADVKLGWPFKSLNKMYGDSPATRFGCWMCTLVREDKALSAVTKHREWEHLTALSPIRDVVLVEGRKDENRIVQPNGNIGRTSLAFRQNLLNRVLELQDDIGSPLISEDEIKAIRAYWQAEQEQGSPYNNQCKFWRWEPAE